MALKNQNCQYNYIVEVFPDYFSRTFNQCFHCCHQFLCYSSGWSIGIISRRYGCHLELKVRTRNLESSMKSSALMLSFGELMIEVTEYWSVSQQQ